MHKISFIVFKLLFWLPFFALSQVGIGTVTPNAQLDIQSSNPSAPASNDGILIPKINEFPAIDPSAAQDGMMVYATGSGSVAKGFYYWNQSTTSWVTIVGSAGIIEKLDDLSDGKSDAAGSSVFLGINAGNVEDGNDRNNLGIGFNALANTNFGSNNLGVGNYSLEDNTTGTGNTALGYATLQFATSNRNTAIGYQVMRYTTTGIENTGVGNTALTWNREGSYNTGIGRWSLSRNESGNGNTAVGYYTGYTIEDGNYNTLIGYQAGSGTGLHTKSYSVFIGNQAGFFETDSHRLYIENSTANQYNALIYGEFDNDLLRINGTLNINNQYSLPTADGTLGQVLQTNGAGNMSWVDQNVTGAENIDDLSDGKSDVSGSSIFLGLNAGLNDDGTNNKNVGIGRNALEDTVDGDDNVAIGLSALSNNISGYDNLALGSISLFSNTSGGGNVAVGTAALTDRATSYHNIALGIAALANGTTGNNNVGIGSWALVRCDGSSNVAVGHRALYNSVTGSNNTTLGYETGLTNLGSGNIFIGYRAGYLEGSGDNKLYIENSDSASPLIYGEFDTNLLRVNGTLDINNQYSFPTADGTSNQVLQTDGSGNLTWGSVLVSDATTASNGLSLTSNDVRLGGTLSQITTLTHGTNNLTFNLNSTGDFVIQDNGMNHLELRDNGNLYLGGDTFWYDEDTSGTALASLGDLGDDGFFWLGNGGAPQHLLNGNGDSAFNVLGLAVDFSIQGDNNANLFYVDGGTDRIGFRIGTPNFDIHLKQSGLTEAGAGGIALESSATTNNWKIYHSGSFLSFAENGVRRSYIQNGTGAYVQTSDRTLKKNITLYPEVLTSVLSLPIYSYHYRDQKENAQKTIGVMAQDVQQVFPEIVSVAENGTLGLQYGGLGPIALKAIQEQQIIIDKQHEKIKLLEKEMKQIKTMLTKLKL